MTSSTYVPVGRRSPDSQRLVWPGKKGAKEILEQAHDSFIDRFTQEGSGPHTCELWCGDNAHAMRELLENPDVAGKVTLAYLDPPFGTGGVFWTEEGKGYEDLMVGEEFLAWLWERLVLVYELLGPNGSLYLHIDQSMVAEAKLLLDELFGKKGFRNLITRKKIPRKNSSTNRKFGNVSDHLLFYAKGKKHVWNQPHEPWDGEKAFREFKSVEGGTGRRYKTGPLHAAGTRKGSTGQEWGGKKPPPGKHWIYSPDKLDKMEAEGRIKWSKNGNPRRKIYLDESPGVAVHDIWQGFLDVANQWVRCTTYPTEKALGLLTRIVATSSNEGDLILDPFCGSGTTLHAAENENRRWVGIDSNPDAIETTIKRLAQGRDLRGTFVDPNVPRAKSASQVNDSETCLKSTVVVRTGPTNLTEKKKQIRMAKWRRLLGG